MKLLLPEARDQMTCDNSTVGSVPTQTKRLVYWLHKRMTNIAERASSNQGYLAR